MRKKNSKNVNAGGRATPGKKRKKRKYLDFYMKRMSKTKGNFFRSIPSIGLCGCGFPYNKVTLFYPTESDFREYKINAEYWLSGDLFSRMWEFSEMRQHVVLFLAAMNREL